MNIIKPISLKKVPFITYNSKTNKKNNSNPQIISPFKDLSYQKYSLNFGSNKNIHREMKIIISNSKDASKLKDLFNKLSPKVQENFNNLLEKFKDYGVTSNKLLVSFSKNSKLFYQSPNTIENNVREFVKRFEKEGLTNKDYLKACIKQPTLLCLSAETIENNIRELANKFSNYGLTIPKILKAALKHPALFCQSPKTIENNVLNLVNRFEKEGLNIGNYLKTCQRQPALFSQLPETISNHINAYLYINKHKNRKTNENNINHILTRRLDYSTSLIYLQGIVEPQIKKQYPEIKNIEGSNIKNQLKLLFEQNPNTQFEIKILKDDIAKNFIKVIEEFAQKDLNAPNAFKIETV